MAMYTRTITWDVAMIAMRRPKIDPRPAYQRGLVWSVGKQQLLIDTMLRGYDVPKIYLRKLPDGAPFEWEVADGQQRLQAIWDFFDGKFALGDASDSLPGFGDLSGKRYGQLSSSVIDKLGLFPLSIVELDNTNDMEIRDLFLRLQEGVSLNPAERRNAMTGTMRDFVADLANNHIVFRLTDVKNTRFTYDDWAAHLICVELADGMTDLKAIDLKKMYSAQSKFDVQGATAKKIKRHLNFMAEVLKNKPPEMDIKWGFVDLYFAISALDTQYVLKDREDEFCSFYQFFEHERRANVSDPSALITHGKTKWDRDLYDYIEVFVKDGGKKESIKRRHEVYIRAILWAIPDLVPKDPKRAFSRDQKIVIYRRDGQMCQNCQTPLEFDAMHADHITPHSQGGETTVCNGQTLCGPCNFAKGAAVIP